MKISDRIVFEDIEGGIRTGEIVGMYPKRAPRILHVRTTVDKAGTQIIYKIFPDSVVRQETDEEGGHVHV